MLQIEQFWVIMMPLRDRQWHQRLLLSRSFLARAATFCGGRRRSDLCRNISSAVFVFQSPLSQHQEELWSSPACRRRARWISNMSSRSGRCSRSQRLFRHREGGVSLTQKYFTSDDENYRRSKFYLKKIYQFALA